MDKVLEDESQSGGIFAKSKSVAND